jgi:hypothetical protein
LNYIREFEIYLIDYSLEYMLSLFFKELILWGHCIDLLKGVDQELENHEFVAFGKRSDKCDIEL